MGLILDTSALISLFKTTCKSRTPPAFCNSPYWLGDGMKRISAGWRA